MGRFNALYPDDDMRPGIVPPASPNAIAPPPTWADAYTQTTQAAGDFIERQRAISAERGLWDERGMTTAGVRDAAGQLTNMLATSTSAPGARGVSLDNPAFAKWFGKSKIVDDEGKPLVVYHGSGHDIPQFDPGRGSQTTGNVTAPWGSFFTPDPKEASRYASTDFHASGQNVTPVHLAIENPHEMTRAEWDKHAMTVFRGQKTQEQAIADALAFRTQLQEAGHDGIVIKGRGFNNEYVAFNPEQIKSTIGNRGTFSAADPRIAYGAAGLMAGGVAAAQSVPRNDRE